MSDETNDETIIQIVRDAVAEYGADGLKAGRYLNPYEVDTFVKAALRTIARVAADRDALRLDYERLQSVNRQLANERDDAIRREEHNAKVISTAAKNHPLTIERLIEALETIDAFAAAANQLSDKSEADNE